MAQGHSTLKQLFQAYTWENDQFMTQVDVNAAKVRTFGKHIELTPGNIVVPQGLDPVLALQKLVQRHVAALQEELDTENDGYGTDMVGVAFRRDLVSSSNTYDVW